MTRSLGSAAILRRRHRDFQCPNALRNRALGTRIATGKKMAEAGETSPHLDQKERRQAAAGAPMSALVIHEIVRDQGEEELERSFGGLAWSGLAAGLSIGFSFLLQR